MSQTPKKKGRGKPRGIRHDRDCATCKARGVKCDLNRPSCGQCISHNVPCEGYKQRVVWRTSHSTKVPPPSVPDQRPGTGGPKFVNNISCAAAPRRPLKDTQAEVDDSNWTTHYFKYLDHFRQKMNRIQTDGKQAGDTITDDSLSSIWFFAWKRMTQSIPVDDASDVEYALCHTAAVEALLQSVDQEGIRAIFGIATFAFIDVYKEPFAAWSRHLRGARAVLDLHSPTPERFAELCSEINGLQEVVSLLCWYDTTGLMIRRDRGLIFEDWHRNLMVDDLFDLVGCPKDVYQIFTIIVKEGFKCESRHPDLYVTATEQLLKTSRGSHDQGDLLQDAWRYSSVMAIYEAESSVKTASFEAIMYELADRICDILQAIPAESAKYRHLPFAAFMVGRLSQSSDHSQAAQRYWETCNSLEDPIYPSGDYMSRND